MKEILCPVDFSISSERISRYAAQLARDTNAKVVLVATHQGKLAMALEGEDEDTGDSVDSLGEMHDLLKMSYGIKCGIEEKIISGNITKKLTPVTDFYDLTVLGAPGKNGKEEFQNFAGIDLVKAMQESQTPLLIVPEHFKYEKIKRLTYAYDYEHDPQPPINQLLWLADWFGAEVRFVSVLSNSSRKEEKKFEKLEREIYKQWKEGIKLSFESVAYKDVAQCLDHYSGLWSENNLLMLSISQQSLLQRLWHKSVVKELLRSAKRPYLIFHK